jgi:hypothetical protein
LASNDLPPSYRVPSAPARIADPGRSRRCLVLLAGGLFPLGYGIFAVVDIGLDGDSLTFLRYLVLNRGGDLAGAIMFPCIGLAPIVLLTLWHNVHAWVMPTSHTIGQANHWIRRFLWALVWAVVAGILLTVWIFWWGTIHFNP